MAGDPSVNASAWRSELPTLTGRAVTLREPVCQDLGPLVDLLSLSDATRFCIDEPVTEFAVHELIERAALERANGISLTYVITQTHTRTVVGLMLVRQLDPCFEAAEWECTLAPSARGCGARCAATVSTSIRCCGRCSRKTGESTGSRRPRAFTDGATPASCPPLRRRGHRGRADADGAAPAGGDIPAT